MVEKVKRVWGVVDGLAVNGQEEYKRLGVCAEEFLKLAASCEQQVRDRSEELYRRIDVDLRRKLSWIHKTKDDHIAHLLNTQQLINKQVMTLQEFQNESKERTSSTKTSCEISCEMLTRGKRLVESHSSVINKGKQFSLEMTFKLSTNIPNVKAGGVSSDGGSGASDPQFRNTVFETVSNKVLEQFRNTASEHPIGVINVCLFTSKGLFYQFGKEGANAASRH